MHNLSRRARIFIIIISVIALLICGVGIYKYQKIRVFNKSQYKDLYSNLELDGESFTKQEDLRDYILGWAKTYDVKCHLDSADNIIFQHKASSRKKNVSPTIIVVNYNYENAVSNRRVLASAFMVAATDLESGKKTVIFVNNKNNDETSYAALDSSLFPDKSKVIYLDYGRSAYVSTRSFCQRDEQIVVPAEKEEITCDTAIKIKIGGIKSDVIDAGVSKHANPITLMSTVLTRLKSKSTICQIADIKVDGKGYMYPTAVEFTVLLNSYAVNSFTAYLDKRIEAFNKSLQEDNPECYYEYKILKSKKFPESAYNKKTFDSLTTALYAIKNGTYRYEDESEIEDGYNESSIYGISCFRNLTADDYSIRIDLTTQATNKQTMDDVCKNNSAVADLSGCSITTVKNLPSFKNKKDGLVKTLKTTYFKVNDLSGNNVTLEETYDTYFTPMTYINNIRSGLDIVHVKLSSKSSSVLTNMLLCYIETKGNFLSL